MLSIDDEGFVSLLDDALGTKEDLKLPEGDLGNQIRAEFEKDNNGILVRSLHCIFLNFLKSSRAACDEHTELPTDSSD